MGNLLLGQIMEGYSDALVIAVIVIGILAIGFSIWGGFMQWSVFFRYQANNRRRVEGKTAKQVAEEMLAKLGYTDIRVEKTSYLWLLFFYKWGNRYSPGRKTIFLYKNILNKNTVTAIAIATQKVGLVIQHKQGDKKMKFRAKWEVWTRLAPNMFIPIITIGAIIDFALSGGDMTKFGIVTLVFVGLSIAYTVIAFYALYLVIPTERRAGQLAFEEVQKNNLIPAEHLDRVKGLYDAQVNVYIADFVLAILNLILDVLYVASKIKK
ncbi:MAG: zinc metallopeptidase [Christensenellaceae bacterium]|nr:zinc metallopeptidase [Christensenellaceae bacterium]